MLPAYAELHCLSNFTFLRGASHPEELVERALALGYAALALTDECSLAGVVRAHLAAKTAGLPLVIGSEFLLGALAAWLLTTYPIPGLPFAQGGVLLMIGAGAVFGIFASTLVGTAVPNSKLRKFAADIDRGKILLIVDVPSTRVDDVQALLGRRHPEAASGGIEPTVPAFP